MRKTAWGAVIGLAVTALTGCGGSSYTTPTLTTTTTTTSTVATASAPQPRTVKWVDLQAGDCLADPPPTDPAVVMVSVVDCGQPHSAEAYLRAPIPVNAALAEVATRECAAGFQHYTGAAPAAGRYTSTYLIDSDQDRTSDNPYPSTVICLVQGVDGQPLTGSARR
ncbi:putative lipoprotein LppN [uncultured Mycobacterium sp.]|uniref:Putative lipoprotein LppN n=1 Tax=uncultured Mycobacterium sp. TaxID=171292 RepID=A0A1Y5PEH9_9MYCO|nr:putative lipoprotein LppN [uncultured Mycobacterium sp.]